MTGLIDLTMPANIEVWLIEPIKYMLCLDDNNDWLDGAHDRDRPVEFLPAGGISIYSDEVSTSNNLSSKSRNIKPSNLLCNIPILTGTFRQYFLIQYDNPMLLDLGEGEINQLKLRLKLQWGNGEQYKLNNHSLPISLELEIK